ncbi:hypothetical protein PMAN_a1894 [Pseudoalteromonas marina]|uniref:sulfotransferase domain-containing protein n=1 Tax=Pseudoalteromonas marina TaxID=267375 RepID=UPI00026CEA26|nr:sulfotransferase domain-containing protein [Pseudoalteromonas marina]KAF7780798.1 hypothetical protein PMAN_a1894 [Pseudoalteromonas marina]
MYQSLFYQLERYSRAIFEAPKQFPSSSVLLASFPKSGNSWFRFVVSNVNSLIEGGEKINFRTIENYSPVIRGNRSLSEIKIIEACPVFLKTHFPYTPFFKGVKSVVVVRNPFFVISSYHNYLEKARGKKVSNIDEFMFDWRYGFNAWGNFMKSWEDKGAIIVRYEDLQASPLIEISKVYRQLGYSIDDSIITKALELSSRDQMKKTLNTDGDRHNNNKFNFVRGAGENKGLEEYRDAIISSAKISKVFLEQAARYGYV